jgi:hypothetical protein
VGCVAGMKVGTPHHHTQQSEDICYLMGAERFFFFFFYIKREFGKPRYLIFSHLPAYHDASFVATFSFIIIYLFSFAHLMTGAIGYQQQASSRWAGGQ